MGVLAITLTLAGCSTSSSMGSDHLANATNSWLDQTNFATVVGGLQNDTAKIATASSMKKPTLTMQTLCGILLLDAQTANNDLPTPDRTATKLLALAYGDLGAGANQCFKAGNANTALQAQSVASRTSGLIALAQATSRLEAVIGQPITTTTTTTTMP